MSERRSRQKPFVLSPDDVEVADEPRGADGPEPASDEDVRGALAQVGVGASAKSVRRGVGWGSVLLATIAGLIVLAGGLWAWERILALLARDDWVGWTALGLAGLAGVAAFMVVMGEIAGLLRLGKLRKIRQLSDEALRQNDRTVASKAVADVKRLYQGRGELRLALQRMRAHESAILDAKELLTLTERELVAPLDREAKGIVAQSAKRVSAVTAISPAALIDVLFVAFEALRMIRRIAETYGGRPGFIGLMGLVRRVFTHIVVTGGVGMAHNLLPDAIGKGIASRLAGRLGEGMINGVLTSRLGIAAIELCRPLAFIEASPPKVREVVGTMIAGGGKDADARPQTGEAEKT